MDRAGRYLKGPTRPTVPGVIFGVAVNARLGVRPNMPHVTIKTWMSASSVVMYRKRNGWTKPETVRHGTPESLHSWLIDRSLVGRINWVVCPIADECLILSRWFEHASFLSCRVDVRRDVSQETVRGTGAVDRPTIERLVAKGTPTIVQYVHYGRRFRWCSIGNWFPADACGTQPDVTPGTLPGIRPVAGGCASVDACTLAAGECAERLRRLADWWRENARAPLGVTVGQCAVSLLRTFAPPKTICSHSVKEAQSLERSASFGGRASVWYVGDIGGATLDRRGPFGRWPEAPVPSIPGPITLIDVRSMYGSIMAAKPVPYKLIGTYGNKPVRELLQLCERDGVIARVRIRTQRAEYPYRSGNRVVYPVGTFTTTLTGPEVLDVSKHGEVLECHELNLYRSGCVLSAFARWLTDPFTRERCAKDVSSPSFPKLLVNSLAGKLAQRPGRWTRSPKRDEPGRWGESHEVSRETGIVVRVRHLDGLAFVWESDEWASGPYAAAFAYIAAWGRLYMADLRAKLPPRVVVSQDTDGCWVLGSSKQTMDMVGELVGPAPGQLRIEASAGTGRFLSPRHYCVDGRWTLSGLHFQAGTEPSPEAWSVVVPSLWQTHSNHPPTQTAMIARKAKLRCEISGGRLMADGWIEPPEIRPRPGA